MRVGIVGGTGAFGRALAERLVALGHEVVIGSRDPERAAELAAVYGSEGKANTDAVSGVDLVVLATKSAATVKTARDLAGVDDIDEPAQEAGGSDSAGENRDSHNVSRSSESRGRSTATAPCSLNRAALPGP